MVSERKITVLAAFILVASIFSAMEMMDSEGADGSFGGGDGTPGNPYIIEDVRDLQNMSNNLSACYVLKNDIDASATASWNSGAGFVPIGNYTNRFIGGLDGKNFTVSGLFINRPGSGTAGLLGSIGIGGYVNNIRILNGNLTGGAYTGGLVGINSGVVNNSAATGNVNGGNLLGGLIGSNMGTASNSYATCDVNGDDDVGGFAGTNGGTVSHSYASGNVKGSRYVGGLIGVTGGTVTDSHAAGNVTGTYDYIGGLVGYAGGILNNSYATGNVKGRENLGGLAGYFGYGTLSNTYAEGNVTGTGEIVGGLVGYSSGTVNNAHAAGNVSGGYRYVGGLVGDNEGAVNNSYATGNVNGGIGYIGGLVGSTLLGTVNNSHYPMDKVLIKGSRGTTLGGLYDAQFQDWLSHNSSLDISDYSTSLVPAGDHYEIGGVQGMKDLMGFAGVAGYRFRLDADIDLATAPELCIPYLAAEFDGGNHTISHLKVNTSYALFVGMFGFNEGGTIKNTGLSDIYVSGYYIVGGLVGYNKGGVVDDSYAAGTVTGFTYTGGLVGYNALKSTVNRSHAKGFVVGHSDCIGGLVGWNYGTVRYSYAMVNVTTFSSRYVGGLVGFNTRTVECSCALGEVNAGNGLDIGGLVGYSDYLVNNSYARVNVTGTNQAGGLVGHNDYIVANSYAAGFVKGYTTGGLVADNDGTVTTSFWDVSTSGQPSSSGGTGKTTADMKRRVTFTDAGWNFTDVWSIADNLSYPFFIWQKTEPPRADAGIDQTVDEGALVRFDGSGSSDEFGIVNYTWTFQDGIPVTLGGVKPSYRFSGPGAFVVTLKVTDAVGLWGADNVTINVVDRTRPVANAGPDRSVDQGTLVTFDGSASSDNVGVVNHTWTFQDEIPVTLYGPRPTYRFDNAGTFVVTLTAKDAAGNRATGTMTVTVLDTTAPVADGGPDRAVDEGHLMVFDASGSSDNVGIVNFTWTFTDKMPVTLYGPQPIYKFDNPGIFVITLTVSDASGRWDSDVLSVTVNDTRSPVADAGPDQSVDERTLVTLDGSGCSDNVGIVNYAWTFVDGDTIVLRDRIPQYRFNRPGVFVVTLNVSDAAGNWGRDTLQIIVKDITPPVADAGRDQTVPVGTEVELNGSLSTDNVGIETYSWTFVYDGKTKRLEEMTDRFVFDKGGVYEVVLKVADLAGNLGTDKVSITVVDTGKVTGTVLDAKQIPVEGATVELIASDGTTCTTKTAMDGTFSVVIHHGSFLWTISKDGYQNISGIHWVDPMGDIQLDLSDHPLKKREAGGQTAEHSTPMVPILALVVVAAACIGGYLIVKRRGSRIS